MSFASVVLSVVALLGGDLQPDRRTEVLGRSIERRPIQATVVGDASTPRKILVIGCIHGNECAGTAVTRLLAADGAARGYDIWLVHHLNPDGYARRIRQNARGVDLNRNFSAGWRANGRRWDATYPGPQPFSEPETRVARRLILRLDPDVTIWFHQPQGNVRAWARPNVRVARRYALLVGLPFHRLRVPPGAATRWQSRRFPGSVAFVVELPRGTLSTRAAARHAHAVRTLAAGG